MAAAASSTHSSSLLVALSRTQPSLNGGKYVYEWRGFIVRRSRTLDGLLRVLQGVWEEEFLKFRSLFTFCEDSCGSRCYWPLTHRVLFYLFLYFDIIFSLFRKEIPIINPGSTYIYKAFFDKYQPSIRGKKDVFAVGVVGSERTSQRQVRGDVIANNPAGVERTRPHALFNTAYIRYCTFPLPFTLYKNRIEERRNI